MTGGPSVAFVSDALQEWGAERSLLLLAAAAPSDLRVDVLVHRRSPLIARRAPGVHAADMARRRARDRGGISSAPLSFLIDLASAVLMAFPLARQLRRYDVVVCYGAWELPQVRLACLLARRPCVLDLHETFDGRLGTLFLGLGARSCRRVIGTSASVLSRVSLGAGAVTVPRPKGNAPSRTELRTRGSKTPLRILMLGQVVPHKRVLDVAEVCAGIASEQAVLNIVGVAHGSGSTPYQSLVATIADASQGSVFLKPRVEDVWPVLQGADVLINASVHEAFGRTVIEGMSQGCWPIVLAGGAPAEIVAASGVGSVLSSLDGLREEIERLASLPEDAWVEMSNRCMSASKRYESTAVAESYFAALKDLG